MDIDFKKKLNDIFLMKWMNIEQVSWRNSGNILTPTIVWSRFWLTKKPNLNRIGGSKWPIYSSGRCWSIFLIFHYIFKYFYWVCGIFFFFKHFTLLLHLQIWKSPKFNFKRKNLNFNFWLWLFAFWPWSHFN